MSIQQEPEAPSMISHTYEPGWKQAGLLGVWTVVTVLAVAAMLRAGLVMKALPPASLRQDPDSVILGTKGKMAREKDSAAVVFVGDSSCLVNVDMSTLLEAGGVRGVNLGLLSYLSIDSFGRIAQEAVKSRGQGKIVLVVHPEALRLAAVSPPHEKLLADIFDDKPVEIWGSPNPVARILGFDELKDRVGNRIIPEPLRGAFGAHYGFSIDLEKELLQSRGTMQEARTFNANGETASGEYRLATRIESECRGFRGRLPVGTRVRIIISPVPASIARKNHESQMDEFQARLESWLGADPWASKMPAVLPDTEFATVTHLLPEASIKYSRVLREKLIEWQ